MAVCATQVLCQPQTVSLTRADISAEQFLPILFLYFFTSSFWLTAGARLDVTKTWVTNTTARSFFSKKGRLELVYHDHLRLVVGTFGHCHHLAHPGAAPNQEGVPTCEYELSWDCHPI